MSVCQERSLLLKYVENNKRQFNIFCKLIDDDFARNSCLNSYHRVYIEYDLGVMALVSQCVKLAPHFNWRRRSLL